MKILIRFGDLMLKGKNQKLFLKSINQHIKYRFKTIESTIERQHDRTLISLHEADLAEAILRLKKIPGIHSFSLVYTTNKDIQSIIDLGINMINKEVIKDQQTFKIETKRSDKSFPLTSLALTKEVAPEILKAVKPQLIVSVYKPDLTLHIDIRRDFVYMHLSSYRGLGGFPYGTQGKGLLMLSGGIDSPVAGFLSIKQGIDLSLIHFESTPMTPLESVQKVIDLAKILAQYTPMQKIRMYLIPFKEIHEAILNHVEDAYVITIMRRMMYRISEKIANKNQGQALINGESIGQVASQTLESMTAIEAVVNMPIIRPLITYDKQEIIDISKDIDAFDISIRQFNDCCSIYVPKRPVIKPKIHECIFQEAKINSAEMIDKAIHHTQILDVTPSLDFIIGDYGFAVDDAISSWKDETDDTV